MWCFFLSLISNLGGFSDPLALLPFRWSFKVHLKFIENPSWISRLFLPLTLSWFCLGPPQCTHLQEAGHTPPPRPQSWTPLRCKTIKNSISDGCSTVVLPISGMDGWDWMGWDGYLTVLKTTSNYTTCPPSMCASPDPSAIQRLCPQQRCDVTATANWPEICWNGYNSIWDLLTWINNMIIPVNKVSTFVVWAYPLSFGNSIVKHEIKCIKLY